jgi:hypothetical protein
MLRRAVANPATVVRLGGPGMNIERLSLGNLKPHPLNAKLKTCFVLAAEVSI